MVSNNDDAREKATPKKAIVGNFTGQTQIPERAGWFYCRFPGLDNDYLLSRFWGATSSATTPTETFNYGEVVMLSQDNDTQPAHWLLLGRVAPGATNAPVIVDPCTGHVTTTGVPYYNSAGGSPPIWPNFQSVEGAITGSTYNPYPGQYVNPPASNPQDKTTPHVSDQPPPYPYEGDLWQRSSTGAVYIRKGDYTTNGQWLIQRGPYSGTYLSCQASEPITPGQVVYEITPGSGLYAPADCTTPVTCFNRVAGIATESAASAGAWFEVICSGAHPASDFGANLINTYSEGNVPLYLLSSGQFATSRSAGASMPVAGSHKLLQEVGVIILDTVPYVLVNIKPCIFLDDGTWTQPRTPRAFSAVHSGSDNVLTWQVRAGAYSYNIYFSYNSAPTTLLINLAGSVGTYTHTGCATPGTYEYWITNATPWTESARTNLGFITV
jgi:hypothetical protein